MQIISGNVLGYLFLILCLVSGYAKIMILTMLFYDRGSSKMREISALIRGYVVYVMSRQFKLILFISSVLSVIFFVFGGYSFIYPFSIFLGVFIIFMTSVVSMFLVSYFNVCVAETAKKGLKEAFRAVFKPSAAGAILNVCTVIFFIGLWYVFLVFFDYSPVVIVKSFCLLSLGLAIASICICCVGGIQTKGADIGSDMAGKIMNNIPEDDAKNPAAVADSVGDISGDCLGSTSNMATVSSFAVCFSIISAYLTFGIFDDLIFLFPLIVLFCNVLGGSFASMIVKYITLPYSDKEVSSEFFKYFVLTTILSLFFVVLSIHTFVGFGTEGVLVSGWNLLISVVFGIAIMWGIMIVTYLYTTHDGYFVHRIAGVTNSGGVGFNIIEGLAVGASIVFLPVLTYVLVVFLNYNLISNLYGISVILVSMFAFSSALSASDLYGAMADNAGGVVEMAQVGKDARLVTDKLDVVGNSVKAITKNCMGVAAILLALSSLMLFVDLWLFLSAGSTIALLFEFSLSNKIVVIGLFMGVMIPFLLVFIFMRIISDASREVISEVQRQFSDGGVLKKGETPNYSRVIHMLVSIAVTKTVQVIVFVFVCSTVPFVFLLMFRGFAGAVSIMLGITMGIVICGGFWLVFTNISGAVWDNVKKCIEYGVCGGKGSETHKASIIGDMVGDVCKDVYSPCMISMIVGVCCWFPAIIVLSLFFV